MTVEHAARHYDDVTEPWMNWIMGEALHFGFFASAQTSLAEATHQLTVLLADRAQLSPGMRVLDVGCGVGTPAMHLAEGHGCQVTGISTSRVGVDLARARAEGRGLSERVKFEARDAMQSGLPAHSFDRVFALESAHLMPDKARLFAECFRVLAPGGKLALCDVVLVGTEGVEIAQYAMLGHSTAVASKMRAAVHGTMHRAFGSTILAHTSVYRDAAIGAGFSEVTLEDISSQTRRTLAHWGQNASDHQEAITARLGPSYLDDFFLALLHMSFGWGRLGGYVVLTATKPTDEHA